jgi:hypothetical protein
MKKELIKVNVYEISVRYKGDEYFDEFYIHFELTEQEKEKQKQYLIDDTLNDLHEGDLDACKSIAWSNRQPHIHRKALEKAKFVFTKIN